MCTHQAHFGFDLKIQKKRQKGHIEKSNCMCRLGAHTETTFWGDKLQYDSCLDTKSHEESSCTSVVMKNKSKGRGEIRPPPPPRKCTLLGDQLLYQHNIYIMQGTYLVPQKDSFESVS